MKMHETLAAMSTIAILSCAASAAQITPTAQTREVSGTAYAGSDTEYVEDADFDAADDFGPFNSAASAYAPVLDGEGSGGGNIQSLIAGTTMSASGGAFANGEGWDYGVWGEGNGYTLFDVNFTLDGDAPYQLDITLEAYDGGNSDALLSGPGGIIHAESAYGPDGFLTVSYDGVLPPGNYRLYAYAYGSAYGDNFYPGYAYASYDVVLTIEGDCGSDLNGDGAVDLADLGILLAAYEDTDAGDLDGDGDTDLADLGILLAEFGCGS